MFVQVIQGNVADGSALTERGRAWAQELAPGAEGFLGSTGGVTADGSAIIVARFADEAAAQANSDRPEQGEWWAETEKLFTGPVTFMETSDVDLYNEGGSDDAGFVQVMKGTVRDRARYSELMSNASQDLGEQRPDLIGGLTAWFGNDYVEAMYFTSEAEAREGEKRMSEAEMPPEMQEFLDLAQGDITYLDLTDPLFVGKS